MTFVKWQNETKERQTIKQSVFVVERLNPVIMNTSFTRSRLLQSVSPVRHRVRSYLMREVAEVLNEQMQVISSP